MALTSAATAHLVKRSSHRLYAEVSGRRMLLFLLLYVVLTITFQVINMKTKALSGAGLLSFEVFYDGTRAHQLLSTYGAEGRKLQLTVVLIDFFLYIPVYTLLFSLVITYFLAKARHSGLLQISNLFPFLIASINMLKDLGILSLLASYPRQIDIVATRIGYLTLAEWTLSSITLGLILLSVVLFLWQTVRPMLLPFRVRL
jgi:hypothetical protein